MLYHLLYGVLSDRFGFLRVFGYPSTRILAAAITALLLSFLIGPWFIERLKNEGLDAVETRHPSHDPDLRARLTDITLHLGLLRTGGSDWHGDPEPGVTHGTIGSQSVPLDWLEKLDALRARSVSPAPS